MKCLIFLDGSKLLEFKLIIIDGGYVVEIGDVFEDGDFKEGFFIKENEVEKWVEFSYCFLFGCVIRERVGLSFLKFIGVLCVILWWKWIC